MSQAEFMQSFVNDLLDLRQLKFENLELECKAFDLIKVMRNIG